MSGIMKLNLKWLKINFNYIWIIQQRLSSILLPLYFAFYLNFGENIDKLDLF